MENYPTNPHSLWRSFRTLVKPFWVSEEKWKGYGLLAVVVVLSLGLVYLNVLFNQWNNVFYNALQNLDAKAFRSSLIRFTYLALIYISLAVYAIYFQQMLEVNWRRWLTGNFVSRWLKEQSYYRLQLTDYSTDNPDQRIAEDVTLFVRTSLGLSLGLLRSVVTLVTFINILWGLSGPLRFSLAGHAVNIPAYMVWSAIVYALAGTVITMLIGRRLVRLNFLQQRYEADFRFSLVRFRENAEAVALYGGEAREHDDDDQRRRGDDAPGSLQA